MKTILLLTSLILLISCSKENKSLSKKIISSELINMEIGEIDQTITQELYEKLYEIYLLRKDVINNNIRLAIIKENKNDVYLPIDSITSKYRITINLNEPKSPYIYIKDVDAYYNGNPNSNITVWEIINPECDLCNIVHKRMRPIHDKYNDKIKFGYILYSKDNALSSQALIYALQEGKYEDLYDRLITVEQFDTTTIYNEMNKLDFNINLFNQQLPFLQERTLNTNIRIQKYGICKTPTIIINNQLIYNPLDTTHIKKVINSLLD